ncbi:MAG TPA: FAD-binding oxidoreductase [Thermomicrobiales bacterium]|nr:FAD-binding oxidoreductase [Thermomicrobiales bacterium]
MTASVGATAHAAPAAIAAFEEQLRGAVIRPGDSIYDEARKVWNGMIDRRPALIVRCAGAADVIAAVRFARAHDLLVAVRGGGHNVAGMAACDGGIVIDLSAMKGIRVDPAGRRAWVEAGALWGDVDRETQAFGLAVTGGIVSHTGVAGLTLGGGIGWLMRKHGLTIDNLLAVDLVTADGSLLRADAHDNSDLFWGVRGGGGNFGVVTSFEFQLHPVGPMVLAGPILYPLERADTVLQFYREFAADAPDELTTVLNLRRAPAVPFLPREIHGMPVVGINVCYAGPIAAGEALLRPLRAFGPPLVDLVAAKPYVEHQRMFDAIAPHGWHYYWKAWELPRLDDGAIETLIRQTGEITSPQSYSVVFHLGGAVGRVGEEATAYSHRDMGFNVNINAAWTPDDSAGERHIGWAKDSWEELRPFAPGAVYLNFLGDEGQERVKAAYGAEKYQRLADLKRKYDPTNCFRLNQNIEPAR